MFLNNVGEATKSKKIIYLIASTILGILLSLLAHAFIEIRFLCWAQAQDMTVTFYGSCVLPPYLQILLWVLGTVGGFVLGRFWWRKIYIEKV